MINLAPKKDCVRHSMWVVVRSSTHNVIWDSTNSGVRAFVWQSVGNSVANFVWYSVKDFVHISARNHLND